MSVMSRLEEPTNFQIAAAIMRERNMSRRCAMKNLGFEDMAASYQCDLANLV
jgi:hypothetical protein